MFSSEIVERGSVILLTVRVDRHAHYYGALKVMSNLS